MGDTNNKKIIEGIIRGDKAILTDFYKQNIQYIRQYILKNNGCKEDVEDVFQDALVLIYQKLKVGSLELSCSIRSYFYGVCKNIWRNRVRRKKKMILDETLIVERSEHLEAPIIDNIAHKEQQHLYRKYFLKLNDSNKKILNLYFEGNNMREIAKLMGYSEGYVRKKKFEAKKILLEMMERDSSYLELKVCG